MIDQNAKFTTREQDDGVYTAPFDMASIFTAKDAIFRLLLILLSLECVFAFVVGQAAVISHVVEMLRQ